MSERLAIDSGFRGFVFGAKFIVYQIEQRKFSAKLPLGVCYSQVAVIGRAVAGAPSPWPFGEVFFIVIC